MGNTLGDNDVNKKRGINYKESANRFLLRTPSWEWTEKENGLPKVEKFYSVCVEILIFEKGREMAVAKKL